ncbi:hypothetical protein ACFY2W_34400 [Streptomyces sp. NPDC001262]|uniref:hypothetical protein n=1 Tax=unclassified Streptomyces TaxID=2593676 RepID=UPI0036774799
MDTDTRGGGPTLGELWRMIERETRLIRDDMTELKKDLARYVPLAVWTASRTGDEKRLQALESRVDQQQRENRALLQHLDEGRMADRERAERDRQARMYQAAIPIAALLVTAVLTVWSTLAGH